MIIGVTWKKIKNTTKGYWHTPPTHVIAILNNIYMLTACCQSLYLVKLVLWAYLAIRPTLNFLPAPLAYIHAWVKQSFCNWLFIGPTNMWLIQLLVQLFLNGVVWVCTLVSSYVFGTAKNVYLYTKASLVVKGLKGKLENFNLKNKWSLMIETKDMGCQIVVIKNPKLGNKRQLAK